jgi:phosphoglycolate phosphatase
MKKIEADLLIFDLDGTLADTGRDVAGAVNFVRVRAGLEPLEVSEVIKCVGSGLRKTLQQAFGDNNKHNEDAVDIFIEYYGKHLLDTTLLYPSVKPILEHFKHKKKVVVSNKREAYCRIILEKLGVDRYFLAILGRDSVDKPKPDPSPLIKIMETLKILPEKAVMIGDGLNDVVAAKAAGIHCCAVGYGFGTRDELVSHNPDFFVDDLKDIIKIIK